MNESQSENLSETQPESQPETESSIPESVDIDPQIAKLTAERDQLNDQLLRTMADFQNFRKRQQQEQGMIRQYATESLVMSLLPVLDNFERTVVAAENGATTESMLTGVRAVEKQLRILIENQGVKRIESVGHPFDANLHEALGTIPSEDMEVDTVAQEIEPGYRMGDKIIRPAKVRVSVKP